MSSTASTLFLTSLAIAISTGCGESEDRLVSLSRDFEQQARAFVESDDPDALDRLWVLGTQLSHPPLPSSGPTLYAYHRSFPDEYGAAFTELRQDFARTVRKHEYRGFAWYRRDTGPATADEEPVLLYAWGDSDFILDVRGVLEDAAKKVAEKQDE